MQTKRQLLNVVKNLNDLLTTQYRLREQENIECKRKVKELESRLNSRVSAENVQVLNAMGQALESMARVVLSMNRDA